MQDDQEAWDSIRETPKAVAQSRRNFAYPQPALLSGS